MTKRSTVLRELLRQRHWQTYSTFCRQYDAAAGRVDHPLVGKWPSRGQFARWLSGDLKGLPHPDHCRVLEAMFVGVTAQQLFRQGTEALGPPAAGPPATSPATLGAATLGPAGTLGALVPTQPGPLLPSAAARALTGQSPPGPAGPRPATGLPAPGHSLLEEVALATQESSRFVRGVRGAVDHDLLDQLAADVRQLAVDYLAKPPLALLRPLTRLRRDVFEMLDQRQRPTLLPPLYAVAGRLCALLAHAGSDLGHGYSAETHTRTAWLCADLADDDSLRGYVRWLQSNIAFWAGAYPRAAQLAHLGQQHAVGGNLLRLASQEARAWAACGQVRDVERALGVVSDAQERDLPDEQVGVFRFDPGKAAYYTSETRLALGGEVNARLAAASAEESLELLTAAPEAQRCPEFFAAARLDLANAHLALGELEAAGEQLRVVLQLPVESRTQPIVGRVASSGKRLSAEPFTRSALALDLRDEIALFRAYPAQRDLPEVLD
jgi:hypothetical protein